MVDPEVELVAIAVAYTGKRVADRVADRVGDKIGDFAARNCRSIWEMVQERLGRYPAQLAPRVLIEAFEEGGKLTDPIMQQYCAGLIISAEESTDDDAARMWIDLLARMTTNQVRIHHAAYAAFAQDRECLDLRNLGMTTLTAPLAPISFLVGLGSKDDAVSEAILGLGGLGLIGQGMAVGTSDHVNGAVEESFQVRPSYLGILLYLRAYGSRLGPEGFRGFQPVRPLDPPGPTLTVGEVGPEPSLGTQSPARFGGTA